MGENLTVPILAGLSVFYLLVMLLNVGFVAYQHYVRKDRTQVLVWTAVAALFLVHSIIYGLAAFRLSSAESQVTQAEDKVNQQSNSLQPEHNLADTRETLKEAQDNLKKVQESF